MKKLLIIAGIVLAIFGCFCIASYCESNNIKDNKASMEAKILNYAKDSNKNTTTATVNKILDIDDMKYVSFTTDTGSGYMTISKTLTGNYGLKEMGLGSLTDKLHATVFNCKGTSYLVVSGENPDKNIGHIDITINNKKYTLNIPSDDEYYAICQDIGKQPKSCSVSYDDIYVYDKDNKDISFRVLSIQR